MDGKSVKDFTVDDSQGSKLSFKYGSFADGKLEEHLISFNVSKCDSESVGNAEYSRKTIGARGKGLMAGGVDATYICECGED